MKTTRGVSIEASWEGDVRGRWFLQPNDRLLVGPTAACDIVVSESVIPRPRELVRLDADGLTFALDLPIGSLLREPQDTSRDAYRRPAWQRIESSPRYFGRDTAIDLRIGPWRLSLRAAEVEPLPRRRSSWACLPLHALAVSLLLHGLVAGLALSTPPLPQRLSMSEPDEAIYLPATWAKSPPTRPTQSGGRVPRHGRAHPAATPSPSVSVSAALCDQPLRRLGLLRGTRTSSGRWR